MKKFLFLIMLSGLTTAHASTTAVYKNKDGCIVEVEQRRNGYTLTVQDNSGQSAALGVRNDHSSGDIFGFCKGADVSIAGDVLTLSCDEQKESGAYTTRGVAKVKLENGISAVAIKGEVKKLFGWKTDTNILCVNLEAQVN